MTTELKVLGGVGLLTIAIIVGGVIFFSKDRASSVPEGEIISSGGIHWHPKVAIYVSGEKRELEDSIGLGNVHKPIHTHTEDYKDGVVHLEMQGLVTKEDIKLGNFFRIWGKDFSSTQIFDKTNGSAGNVRMFVNGAENTDFENYLMRDGDKIEIRYE